MTDRRWGRLSRWVRERKHYYDQEAKRQVSPFYAALEARAETFNAVLLVMEMETRKHRKLQRRTR